MFSIIFSNKNGKIKNFFQNFVFYDISGVVRIFLLSNQLVTVFKKSGIEWDWESQIRVSENAQEISLNKNKYVTNTLMGVKNEI